MTSDPPVRTAAEPRAAIADLVRETLARDPAPSAFQLVAKIDELVGTRGRWDMKSVLESLTSDGSLTDDQVSHVRSLIDGDELTRALRGEVAETRAVLMIENLIVEGRKYRDSKDFGETIDFMAKFRDYAPYNNMLVRVQNPHCNFFATRYDWEHRFGRFVKEDARPMLILVPMGPVTTVYDLDQTWGKPLPDEIRNFSHVEGKWDQRWWHKLLAGAYAHKIRVDLKPLSSTSAGFATVARHDSPYKMRIAIHDEPDEPSRFGTLCHELAHILLGHLGGDRDDWWPARGHLGRHAVEVEAEATAHVVTRRLGLSGTSEAYVSRHLIGGTEVPEGVSFDRIATVAGKLEKMTKGTQPPPKVKGTRRA